MIDVCPLFPKYRTPLGPFYSDDWYCDIMGEQMCPDTSIFHENVSLSLIVLFQGPIKRCVPFPFCFFLFMIVVYYCVT